MGLFDSTIQNLSNMAINESACELPQVAAPALVDEFKAMLDMMPTLNEDEMVFPAYSVPVRECSRLGKYLIEMEDISRYMITNGQTNILEAVKVIGNQNGIRLDESNTALVIDEHSVLQEMDELGMDIGGGNSNEGNIGTVGLLGPHTDIGKFRRFANSREFIDLVANKYGLPIVKKNYSIGLIKADEGYIKHNGNLQESAPLKTTGINAILQEKDKEKKQTPVQEDVEPITEEYTQLDMIRDIALGKYDNELMAESVGGPAFDIEEKKTLSMNLG